MDCQNVFRSSLPAMVLLALACSEPAPSDLDDGRHSGGIPSPPLPPQGPPPPTATIIGTLAPADSTVNVDMVTVFFVSFPGDSTCTPDQGARQGELGFAVSDSGSFSGEAYGWHDAIPACFHLFAKRTRQSGSYPRFDLVQVSQHAVRVTFRDSIAGPFKLEGVLPAGPDAWERHYRHCVYCLQTPPYR